MKEPISLPDVTLIICDTVNYSLADLAILKSLEQIKPARTIFFTDITYPDHGQFEVVNIKHLFSKNDYSEWMIKELGKQDIKTSHVLVIQHDGYVLDGERWEDEFLKYSFIGATWFETDGYNVGNGGFSLRSMDLCRALANDDLYKGLNPEDSAIARIYRDDLEKRYNVTFAPDAVANRFSYELNEPCEKTFGFHGNFHPPYRETVVIKRQAALGDIVQLEPVLEWFHTNGYRVVLDTLPQFYALFAFHRFPIEDYGKFNKRIKHRVINLDLSYESMPQKLHLEAYFQACGVSNYKLRNPKMNFNGQNKLFNRYVVVHIDQRATTHRNIFGIDWKQIENFLESYGLTVIQIGKNESDIIGTRFNTVNEAMLMWLLAHAEMFLGIDSGPANLAVALDRRSVIFFGSVDPAKIHYDRSKIIAIQSECPINNAGCWHTVIGGTEGVPCPVDKDMPPCCVVGTVKLIEGIKKAMTL